MFYEYNSNVTIGKLLDCKIAAKSIGLLRYSLVWSLNYLLQSYTTVHTVLSLSKSIVGCIM